MQRYRSIDILRGLAIILMIQIHCVENLSSREDRSGWLYDASTVLGSLPAPFFTFVSGLSYGLWLRKQKSLGRRDREITRVTLRRGLFLFLLGIVFNFCIWLPEETFNWDILTLLGTSLLFLAVGRKLPVPVLTLICVLILLLTPLLRVVGDFSAYWEDNAYTYDFKLRDIFFGFFTNGYFPLFPWIIFPIAGFVCGEFIVQQNRLPTRVLNRLGVIGIAALGLAGLLVAFQRQIPTKIAQQYASGLTEFPASTEFVLAMVGFVLISLAVLHRWVDARETPSDGRYMTALRRFSSFSLTVYVLHHMLILWPLWIYGAWMGHEDSTFYWREAISTPMALLVAATIVSLSHFLLRFLDKHRRLTIEALMRRICDRRSDPATR